MFTRAVIVAGHAILKRFDRMEADDAWFLLDYQKGEGRLYLEHVRRGVELAAGDEQSLLIFAGGASREEAGPRTEALSYWCAAEALGWFGHEQVETRAICETGSRDSFENLLFGIARFREYADLWPEHVTMVGWNFKEERFHMHREAIRWPRERYAYIGANDPDALEQALRAEDTARRQYGEDPYSGSEFYQEKRRQRNPQRHQHGYFTSCPELRELFLWRGPERFSGPLPW